MKIRLGTRGSNLALAQSRGVAADLRRVAGVEVELVVVRTSGDRLSQVPLREFAGVGAFTREIDLAQRAGEFELSVHSLKDLPTAGREGLRLVAVPERAPVEDCLVAREGGTLDELPQGACVGTGSARRAAQLLSRRPDLRIEGIRGNVETRLGKVESGDYDATLLARAGLVRLGLVERVTEVLSTDVLLPAAAQGALALVVSDDAPEVAEVVRRLEDAGARAEVDAERAVLGELGGGCHLPVGVLARREGGRLHLRAAVVAADGAERIDDAIEGEASEATELGRRLGRRLVEQGARELLPA